MATSSQPTSRNIGATIAVFIAIVLIGVFALMIASRDDDADSSSDSGTTYNEPALPQDARYPQGNDKFAPGRMVPTPEPTRGTTLLMPCQGDGLVDVANNGDHLDVAKFCDPRAYPAGEPDGAEPLVPTGGGSLYAGLTR